jgi:hypothetical protein
MTLKTYLALMIIATLVAWLGFGIVVLMVDPQSSNWLGIVLFYVTLIMAVTGTGSIIGFIIRFLFLKHELIVRSVLVAFRQGFFAAILISALLFIFSRDIFSWLNLGLLIVCLTALEFLLLSLESDRLRSK